MLSSGSDGPRLTFWTEACVPEQLTPSGAPSVFLELDRAPLPSVSPRVAQMFVAPTPMGRGRRGSRGESLGGDMERLLGVPSMKSGRVPSGKCSTCSKKGQHGSALTVSCSKCKETFCNLECSGKHECPKTGVFGFLKSGKKKQ